MEDMTQQLYAAFSRPPEACVPRVAHHHAETLTARDVALSITPAAILFALHKAREAREYAVSYRDFKVGAAVIGQSYDAPGRIHVFTGFNIKPDPNSELNAHAEQMALRAAADHGMCSASVVAVVGETQPDQQSGRPMATLHPCGKCRSLFAEHPLIRPQTIIATALPSLRTLELSTQNALQHYHEDHSTGSDEPIARFDLPDMEILRPVIPPADGRPILLVDNESVQLEEDIWNRTVGAYVLGHLSRQA